jgi:type II secretory pathway component PulF
MPSALAAVFIHAMCWGGLLYTLIYVVPVFKKQFADFGVKLPFLTELCINFSDWMVDYWYVLVIPILVGLAADGAIAYMLRLSNNSRAGYWLWLLFLAIIPLTVVGVVITAVYGPLIGVMENLSR